MTFSFYVFKTIYNLVSISDYKVLYGGIYFLSVGISLYAVKSNVLTLYNPLLIVSNSLFIFISSFIYFLNTMSYDKPIQLNKEFGFWLSVGNMIWGFMFFMKMGVFYFFESNNKEMFNLINSLFIFTNIIVYLIMFYALRCQQIKN